MATTPDEIAALLKSRGSADESTDDKSWRTYQLKEVLVKIRQLSADGLAAIVEKLGDGARDPSWRLPLGDSGVLDFILSVVPGQEAQHPLSKQALRLVGNACADCDDNRARVVESKALSSFIIGCFKHGPLLPFAVAATLNLCVDYNPAQFQASEAGLSKVLVDIVSGDRLSSCQSSLTHIMSILELLTNQDPEPKVANLQTPALLLGLATGEEYDADLDSFMEICTPALAYLTFQDLQPAFLEPKNLELLQLAFSQLYTRFDTSALDSDTATQLKQIGDGFLNIFADISALPAFATTCSLESKVAQTLIDWLGTSPPLPHLQTAACLALGNLCRSDESSIALLQRILQTPLLDILTRAIPPAPSQAPVPQGPTPPLQLIHATLAFLKNLAIPAANKSPLGALLLNPSAPILPHLWTSTRTQPQLQFAAVSLTRLLLVNCPTNVRLICTPLSPNTPNSTSDEISNLTLLLTTAFSADEDPIKTEASRAASQVCRTLHSPSSSTSTSATAAVLDPSWIWTTHDNTNNDILSLFHATHSPSLTRALTHLLLTQPRFPQLRSDTIFILALMSRSPFSSSFDNSSGAHTALRVLQSQDGAGWRALGEVILEADNSSKELGELVNAISGRAAGGRVIGEVVDGEGDGEQETEEKDGEAKQAGLQTVVGGMDKLMLEPQQADAQTQRQPAGIVKRDRENAMVLVAELLRRFPVELSALKRPLEAVLGKGAELVVQDREQGQK